MFCVPSLKLLLGFEKSMICHLSAIVRSNSRRSDGGSAPVLAIHPPFIKNLAEGMLPVYGEKHTTSAAATNAPTSMW
jgi:hypothetical protein